MFWRTWWGSNHALAKVLLDAYLIGYMIEIRQTDEFARWFATLRDPGDVKPLGDGASEMRIDYGPGYRVYFIQRGSAVVVLLAGGDKRTQDRDIQTARLLAREL
jgi:putative component of toxin-antitoxin plasmid stabilization module